MADWVDWVRALHILSAVLWAGGGIFMVSMIGPALRAAGPAAGGFMGAVFRRGGFSMFFAPVGLVAIVTGALLYNQYKVHDAISSAYGMLITIGAVLAVLAWLDGLVFIMPVNRRLVKLSRSLKGPPTPEQQAEMQDLGMKMGMRSGISMMIVGLALVCMLLARALA